MRMSSTQSYSIAVVMSLIGLGCGSSSSPTATAPAGVTGSASADMAVVSVSLKDSASPASSLTTTPDASGAFSFDTAKLTPPFFVKAETASGALYAIASKEGRTNVNPITTAACAGASEREDSEDGEDGWSGKDSRSSGKMEDVIQKLSQVLKPLFDLYGITRIGDQDHDGERHDNRDESHLRALLQDVRFQVKKGVVTVTNRATDGIIFVGPLRHLDKGTFYPENMPAGPHGTPGACAYTYTNWNACQADGTQTRTVLTTSPAGCTGTPVVSQSCTYVPPGSTCTSFTYSAFGACQPDGTQTRTILTSSPAGCTGGTPVLSQACTYVPPVNACTSFTYSDFGACQPDGTQTRTILTSSPAGCTGGTPVLSQACTYVPPVTTCTSFTYSAFGACQPDGTQTRTVLTSLPAGCTGGTPVLSQACTYVPPTTCTLATAVASCSTCHGSPYPASHSGRALTCANCHGPVNNGTGTPSAGMSATLSGTTCTLTYPTSGTHNNGAVNLGAAQ
jgi:hypothetical protein